jgi:hypothetical protein
MQLPPADHLMALQILLDFCALQDFNFTTHSRIQSEIFPKGGGGCWLDMQTILRDLREFVYHIFPNQEEL